MFELLVLHQSLPVNVLVMTRGVERKAGNTTHTHEAKQHAAFCGEFWGVRGLILYALE